MTAAPEPTPDPLRERYAAAIRNAACTGNCGLTEAECARHRIQPVVWHRGIVAEVSGSPEMFADAVLAILPAPADELAATTCSAQYHGHDEARICIRAAQHLGKAHTDEHGFHWSDTVAVYPVADGTWRTGPSLRERLRRVAAEEQPARGVLPELRRLAQVRALHYEVDGSPHSEGSCITCGDDYPCPTIRILDQPTQEDQ